MDKTSLTTQQKMKIVCINLIHQQKPKQAELGVPHSRIQVLSWARLTTNTKYSDVCKAGGGDTAHSNWGYLVRYSS